MKTIWVVGTLLLSFEFGGSFAWSAEPDPDALLNEALSLGRRTDFTIIGKEGLTIRGANLEGDGVKRPSMLMARAAELYAMRALETGNFGELQDPKKALALWSELQDWKTPVGFLLQFRKRFASSNPSLAAACDFELAQCYEHQGDSASALALYGAYASTPCGDEAIGRCKAGYALWLAKERRYKEAVEIAEEVKAKCPPRDVWRNKLDAYGMALQALNLAPLDLRGGEAATAAAASEESVLLAGAKSNPRRYLQLGQNAEQRNEKSKAMEYYGEFRRNFPTDETSINLGLKLARWHAENKQPAPAMEAYQSVWVTNPTLPQAATARIEAAGFLVQTGRMAEGVKLLQDGIAQSQAAGVKASLMAGLAELHLANRKMDEAAALYIQLMAHYGEQDAARGGAAKLKAVAGKIKNWQTITQQIYTWLTGNPKGRPPYGIHELTPQAASDLRRLALTFFIQNYDLRGGFSWLQQCGTKARDEDVNWIVTDEAWFYAEAVQSCATTFRSKLRPSEIPAILDMGLRGWNIAKENHEGWDSLKATANFIQAVQPKTDRVKKLCDILRSLKGTAYEEEAADLLIDVLDAIGDKKEADKIRKSV